MHRRSFDNNTLWAGKKGASTANPAIPEPLEKEIPVTEQLTVVGTLPDEDKLLQLERNYDTRLREVKPYHPILKPEYNTLYGTTRSEGDWRYLIDNYAVGQFTTVAGATIQVPVTMAIALDNKRLMQWPGSTQLFLCIRGYSQTPIVKNLATPVGMTTIFQDISGMGVPLLATISDTPQNAQNLILFPSPITDSGILTVGNLLVKLEATGTTATYDWMIAFSYAYMIAAEYPYERVQQTKGGLIHVRGSDADY